MSNLARENGHLLLAESHVRSMPYGVSWPALGVLLAYVALTLSYSVGLKRLALVDGFALATQLILRLALGVVAGAAVALAVRVRCSCSPR